jgi:UDP-N-acetyl-D-mannosaminuronic acid dehydrogenase
MARFDVCIVGTGRVGLPLGLSLIDSGVRTVGVDVDPHVRECVNGGLMPFREPGYDALIAQRSFAVHATPEVVAESECIVITVGTPLHNHVETDLSQIQRVLEGIRPYLREGQLLCLRSTVAPGTTAFVKRWLERNTAFQVGTTFALAFCPERIAEGKAFEELRSLPQIIGTEDALSKSRAEALFSHLAPETLHTDYVGAELVKLFNNVTRYVHFALANQFAIIADSFGASVHSIRSLANHRYPRNQFAAPGFTAGTCLRKDFGMINEWSPYPDMLLSAWKMNEYMPAFLVQHLRKRTAIHGKRIAVLGYSFKADTDDVRDSLAPKLYRYLEREIPESLRVHDPYLPTPLPSSGGIENADAADALSEVDCVFVATNHAGFSSLLRGLAQTRPGAWVADIWNLTGHNEIFYQAAALAHQEEHEE